MNGRLDLIADALALGRIKHHIFLCADQTEPKCCSREESAATWLYLKARLAELGLSSAAPAWRGNPVAEPIPAPGDGTVLRSKVDCLRICEEGPIAVVYPEGVWYRGVTPEVMERIITDHIMGGSIVEEHAFVADGLDSGQT
jgi:(2Fe-2S) ferredoxin